MGLDPPRQGSNSTCNSPDPGQMPPLLADAEEWGAHHLEKLFVTLETTVTGRKFLNLSLALPVGEAGLCETVIVPSGLPSGSECS